jgi:hypothetical protein
MEDLTFTAIETPKCPICLDNLVSKRKIYTTSCNHTFHQTCLESTVSDKCPCCRTTINMSLNHTIKFFRSRLKDYTLELKNRKISIRNYVRYQKNNIYAIRDRLRNAKLQLKIHLDSSKDYIGSQVRKIHAVKHMLRTLYDSPEMHLRKENNKRLRELRKKRLLHLCTFKMPT